MGRRGRAAEETVERFGADIVGPAGREPRVPCPVAPGTTNRWPAGTAVLLIGFDPYAIPGVDAGLVEMAIAMGEVRLKEQGFETDYCLVAPDEAAERDGSWSRYAASPTTASSSAEGSASRSPFSSCSSGSSTSFAYTCRVPRSRSTQPARTASTRCSAGCPTTGSR